MEIWHIWDNVYETQNTINTFNKLPSYALKIITQTNIIGKSWYCLQRVRQQLQKLSTKGIISLPVQLPNKGWRWQNPAVFTNTIINWENNKVSNIPCRSLDKKIKWPSYKEHIIESLDTLPGPIFSLTWFKTWWGPWHACIVYRQDDGSYLIHDETIDTIPDIKTNIPWKFYSVDEYFKFWWNRYYGGAIMSFDINSSTINAIQANEQAIESIRWNNQAENFLQHQIIPILVEKWYNNTIQILKNNGTKSSWATYKEYISALQYLLKKQWRYSSDINGNFQDTKKSIVTFQKKSGLAPDGNPGKDTISKLLW
jgi:hypothetical protein